MSDILKSKSQIVHGLKKIGLNRGDHLAVGVSFRSLGPVDGGPDTFIDALIDAVGPDGTVMMNTHTIFFNLAEVRLGWTDYVFDAQTTPCVTGIVAESFRQRKEAFRSRHPTCSIAAIGKHARFLTEGHDENADAYMPFRKLAEINGKYLAVGIGDNLAGFRHCAQQEAGLLASVPWMRAVRYKDRRGDIKTYLCRDCGGCTLRLPELVNTLRMQNHATDGVIGSAAAILVRARESLESMTAILKENPAVNLCENPLCYWCRELERRLNLYGKIKNPRIFQRNKPVIHAISLINRIRDLDNRVVVKFKLLIRNRLKELMKM